MNCQGEQRIVHDTKPTNRGASVTGIILAGGKSRRMAGVNKALLHVGQEPIIERVRDVVTQALPRTILITNTPDDFAFLGLPMFPDIIPNAGSLGGLYTGLYHCQTQFGFLVACDMPFLNPGIIQGMIDLVDDYDVVIPCIDSRLEPLHAIYSKTCIPFVQDLLRQGNLRILDLYDLVKVRPVSEEFLKKFDPEFQFVMNVNSPADLKKAIRIAAQRNAMTRSSHGA
ncbi:MAG: molybdenum cofactor guanylyltransferase [Desulfomonilaceae bacterium]